MPKSKDCSAFVTIKDAAHHFACSTDTIRRLIARGELKAYRVGTAIRIKRTDLEKPLQPVTNLAEIRGGGVSA